MCFTMTKIARCLEIITCTRLFTEWCVRIILYIAMAKLRVRVYCVSARRYKFKVCV